MNYHQTLPVDEFKIKAAILLKSLKSDAPEKAEPAAKRFQLLPEMANLSDGEIINSKENLRLKHAFRVIALENGFPSWNEFKASLESAEPANGEFSGSRKMADRELLGNIKAGGFLNNWYPNYEQAKDCLDLKGGYLLVYKNHFFVCDSGYIEALGLDPEDPDWDKIGRDWEKPLDTEAWQRLYNRLVKLNFK
jgi:hypothetical protein